MTKTHIRDGAARALRLHPAPPLCLALGLALAACSSPAGRDTENDDAGANASAVTPRDPVATGTPRAPAATGTPQAKSILRPEVAVPVPEEPALRPVDEIAAFDERGKTLDPASATMLDALVASPAVQAGGAITLRGHSDSRGTDTANLAASRRRAESVRDYLVAKGIDPDRISVIALGETTPLVPNARPDGSDDPEARRRNRRVEVHVALPVAEAPADDVRTDNTAAPAS